MKWRLPSSLFSSKSGPVWRDELDFVGPRVRTASWSWLILLVGLTAGAWVWPMVMQADADLTTAQVDLKRLQRAAHQQALVAKAVQLAQDKPGSSAGLSSDGRRRAAQLAQWMGYPWLKVFNQVEFAAQEEKAVMLAFNLDIGNIATTVDAQPEVHLVAAVHDDESALRWTQLLGGTAQLRGRQQLSQSFQSPSGPYDLRVDAAWSGDTP